MRVRLVVLFTAAIALLFLFAILTAKDFPFWDRMYPLVVGTLGLLIALIELASELRRKDEPGEARQRDFVDLAVDEFLLSKAGYRRAARVACWLLGLYLGIWVLGFKIAVTLWFVLFLKLDGRVNWLITTALTALAVFIIFVLFEEFLSIFWPLGLLQQWVDLPWLK